MANALGNVSAADSVQQRSMEKLDIVLQRPGIMEGNMKLLKDQKRTSQAAVLIDDAESIEAWLVRVADKCGNLQQNFDRQIGQVAFSHDEQLMNKIQRCCSVLGIIVVVM